MGRDNRCALVGLKAEGEGEEAKARGIRSSLARALMRGSAARVSFLLYLIVAKLGAF